MPVTIRTLRSRQFIEPGPYICLLATGLVILAWLVSLYLPNTLLHKRYRVEEGEPVRLESIQLKRELIGALRIDVRAIIPDNHWVTYEIQILDGQGNLLASALKPAWKESGIWQEEGERGTWQEEDLMGGLDVRLTKKDEVVTLALAVLEYTDTAGREIYAPVPFWVTVKNRAIDSRYLLAGLFGTTSLSILSFLASYTTGNQVINKWVQDSELGGRAILGGSKKLVKVTVNVTADETSPSHLQVNLGINDGYGEQIYARSGRLTLHFQKDDEGDIEQANGSLCQYFLLEKRDSYGFYIEVTPDAPVELTQLNVREGFRSLGQVEVVQISLS